uniref:(northern house mosquito) hypothetical protein n=1 Tax=Culex pipiens TaxID=7175 RepID=A0A8D8FK97_CULPI
MAPASHVGFGLDPCYSVRHKCLPTGWWGLQPLQYDHRVCMEEHFYRLLDGFHHLLVQLHGQFSSTQLKIGDGLELGQRSDLGSRRQQSHLDTFDRLTAHVTVGSVGFLRRIRVEVQLDGHGGWQVHTSWNPDFRQLFKRTVVRFPFSLQLRGERAVPFVAVLLLGAQSPQTLHVQLGYYDNWTTEASWIENLGDVRHHDPLREYSCG